MPKLITLLIHINHLLSILFCFLQIPARQCGFPWALSKSFDSACPVSRFIKPGEIKDPHNIEIWNKINGKLNQKSNTNDLLFNIPQLICYIAKYITLEEGDLILTGTPPGDSKVKRGDCIELGITNLIKISFPVE